MVKIEYFAMKLLFLIVFVFSVGSALPVGKNFLKYVICNRQFFSCDYSAQFYYGFTNQNQNEGSAASYDPYSGSFNGGSYYGSRSSGK